MELRPKIGDLVKRLGSVGVVAARHGQDIKIHWVQPWMHEGRLIESSWAHHATAQILSTA